MLRLIHAGIAAGGYTRNYCRASAFVTDADGAVSGVCLEDAGSTETRRVQADVIINATGIWINDLYGDDPIPYRVRPLRGSHLVFQRDTLPVDDVVLWQHVDDGRYVFAYPWAGATVIGTTDIDHGHIPPEEPHITAAEFDYLLGAVQRAFPNHPIDAGDVVATFSGIRPVVDASDGAPSAASRDHLVWQRENVLIVTGGKYTAFRYMVADVVRHLCLTFPAL